MLKGSGGLLAAATLLLAACSGGDEPANSAAETNQASAEKRGTLADALGKQGDAQFAAVIQAAGLQPTLAGPGPYTVLVPTDQAFANLPAGELERLKTPAAKADLVVLLTNHVLPGTMLAADIGKAIDAGQGKAMLATMGGGTLTATREGDRIVLTDGNGGRAVVTAADSQTSNGVIHRIDAVLKPSAEQGGATAAR